MLSRYFTLLLILSFASPVRAVSNEEASVLQDHCREIAAKLASVNYRECIAHNFEMADGHSVKGSPILVKRFHSDTDKMPNKRVLLIGGIHGDEYSSVSVVFKWITLMDQYYTGSFHWQIVPLLNPDGLLQKLSSRVNANGVDLDSNFPASNGHVNASQYWEESINSDPEYFPGNKPLSEPETQWLVDEIDRYKPDAIITVHAPNTTRMYKLAKDKQLKLGAQYQDSTAAYPGSFSQYIGSGIKIPILTIELPYADIMPARSEINGIWRNLIKWLNETLEPSGRN